MATFLFILVGKISQLLLLLLLLRYYKYFYVVFIVIRIVTWHYLIKVKDNRGNKNKIKQNYIPSALLLEIYNNNNNNNNIRQYSIYPEYIYIYNRFYRLLKPPSPSQYISHHHVPLCGR